MFAHKDRVNGRRGIMPCLVGRFAWPQSRLLSSPLQYLPQQQLLLSGGLILYGQNALSSGVSKFSPGPSCSTYERPVAQKKAADWGGQVVLGLPPW